MSGWTGKSYNTFIITLCILHTYNTTLRIMIVFECEFLILLCREEGLFSSIVVEDPSKEGKKDYTALNYLRLVEK